MPSKKQRAKAAKALKAQQPPVTAPPQPHKTLRQQARAADRANRRAPGNTPMFVFGDNAVPRALDIKQPPPQLSSAYQTWVGTTAINANSKLRLADTRGPGEEEYVASITREAAQKSSALDLSTGHSTGACTRDGTTEHS
jgi:hypothetical protein